MCSKTPATMKAWQCKDYSRLRDPRALALVDPWALVVDLGAEVPSPSANEVLVKVLFAAAGPVDVNILGGAYRDRFPGRGLPFVPGLDAAGEVVAIGEECSSGLQVGDRVVLCHGLEEAAATPSGAFAEFCVCPEVQLCKVPPDMQLSAVAGLPYAGLAAYQALFTGAARSSKGECLGDVKEGSKVLILGGDRGPGHIAVQLAHQAGAEVITTAAPSKLDFLRCLGADRVVDWRERDWTAQLRGQDFDLVFDCVGWMASPEEMGKAVKVMKPGGQFISIPDFEVFEPEGIIKDRHFKAMVPKVNADDLKHLVRQLTDGLLQVTVDRVYLFEELPHALSHSASGQTNGKVVISMEHHVEPHKGWQSGWEGGA